MAPSATEPTADSEDPTAEFHWAVFHWDLPPGFPQPLVPAGNPMTVAKVELGRRLFYDPRLSVTGDTSCATCHRQELAFTDGRAMAVGATGEVHRRSAMSLANVAYNVQQDWSDLRQRTLEKQLLTPLFGRHPVEMGLDDSTSTLARLRAEDDLLQGFDAAFPGDETSLTFENLARAIAAFERTLLSGNAPFDRYWFRNQPDALSDAQRQGMRLFFSRRLACSSCHRRFNLSGPLAHEGSRSQAPEFHNTGLYNLRGGHYPAVDQGLIETTQEPSDMGRFRAPTLRNIAVTGPYMHDGSIDGLEQVIEHYAAGGRTLLSGPHAGIGSANRWKSPRLQGFEITEVETRQLIAFLHSLTDEEFLHNPDLADPSQRAIQPTAID